MKLPENYLVQNQVHDLFTPINIPTTTTAATDPPVHNFTRAEIDFPQIFKRFQGKGLWEVLADGVTDLDSAVVSPYKLTVKEQIEWHDLLTLCVDVVLNGSKMIIEPFVHKGLPDLELSVSNKQDLYTNLHRDLFRMVFSLRFTLMFTNVKDHSTRQGALRMVVLTMRELEKLDPLLFPLRLRDALARHNGEEVKQPIEPNLLPPIRLCEQALINMNLKLPFPAIRDAIPDDNCLSGFLSNLAGNPSTGLATPLLEDTRTNLEMNREVVLAKWTDIQSEMQQIPNTHWMQDLSSVHHPIQGLATSFETSGIWNLVVFEEQKEQKEQDAEITWFDALFRPWKGPARITAAKVTATVKLLEELKTTSNAVVPMDYCPNLRRSLMKAWGDPKQVVHATFTSLAMIAKEPLDKEAVWKLISTAEESVSYSECVSLESCQKAIQEQMKKSDAEMTELQKHVPENGQDLFDTIATEVDMYMTPEISNLHRNARNTLLVTLMATLYENKWKGVECLRGKFLQAICDKWSSVIMLESMKTSTGKIVNAVDHAIASSAIQLTENVVKVVLDTAVVLPIKTYNTMNQIYKEQSFDPILRRLNDKYIVPSLLSIEAEAKKDELEAAADILNDRQKQIEMMIAELLPAPGVEGTSTVAQLLPAPVVEGSSAVVAVAPTSSAVISVGTERKIQELEKTLENVKKEIEQNEQQQQQMLQEQQPVTMIKKEKERDMFKLISFHLSQNLDGEIADKHDIEKWLNFFYDDTNWPMVFAFITSLLFEYKIIPQTFTENKLMRLMGAPLAEYALRHLVPSFEQTRGEWIDWMVPAVSIKDKPAWITMAFGMISKVLQMAPIGMIIWYSLCFIGRKPVMRLVGESTSGRSGKQ